MIGCRLLCGLKRRASPCHQLTAVVDPCLSPTPLSSYPSTNYIMWYPYTPEDASFLSRYRITL